MTSTALFRSRIGQVTVMLRSIKKAERQQSKNKRPSVELGTMVASARAASYVMMYNAIESSVRSALYSVREEISTSYKHFVEVEDFWQVDTIQSKFLDKMQDGTNHSGVIRDMITIVDGFVVWPQEHLNRMPAGGNFGTEAAFRLKSALGLRWTAPPRTLGGNDLENIRIRRNNLSHGFEEFENVGNTVTADDLLEIVGRVEQFMVSYLDAIERYRESKSYLRSYGPPRR
ncbi:MAE_28990/MAE_18760 family HEPN-like nuclease [Methylobacterium sp. 1973]|uniref:MAE_28990/MAE_18760 family HEPN-like nuclease n=1 Tax=Methylobacterium sp. 1973 TaxID=3156421 RepID=UPI003391F745